MQTFDVNGSTVTVESMGPDYDPSASAFRQRYAYSVVTSTWRYDGNDIRSGCGAAVDEPDAARTLFAFLSAAAESYPDGENADLFPVHVTEWAVENSDALQLLSIEEELLS